MGEKIKFSKVNFDFATHTSLCAAPLNPRFSHPCLCGARFALRFLFLCTSLCVPDLTWGAGSRGWGVYNIDII